MPEVTSFHPLPPGLGGLPWVQCSSGSGLQLHLLSCATGEGVSPPQGLCRDPPVAVPFVLLGGACRGTWKERVPVPLRASAQMQKQVIGKVRSHQEEGAEPLP